MEKTNSAGYEILENKLQQAELKARQANVLAWQEQYRANQAEAKVLALEEKLQKVQYTANVYFNQINALHASKSWKLTTPLRWFLLQINLLKQDGLARRFQLVLEKIERKILLNLAKLPKTKQLLNNIGIVKNNLDTTEQNFSKHKQIVNSKFNSEIDLTSRGKQFLKYLKQKNQHHYKESN